MAHEAILILIALARECDLFPWGAILEAVQHPNSVDGSGELNTEIYTYIYIYICQTQRSEEYATRRTLSVQRMALPFVAVALPFCESSRRGNG